MKLIATTPAERVLLRCVEDPLTGCLEWLGCYSGRGHGQISVGGKMIGTHVVIFESIHGYRPPMVCHSCDNPPCCNGAHLFPGTAKVNTADMWAKKRQGLAVGENHPANRLSREQVIAIDCSLGQGVAVKLLAQQNSVSTSCIYDIKNGKRYKWVFQSDGQPPNHDVS